MNAACSVFLRNIAICLRDYTVPKSKNSQCTVAYLRRYLVRRTDKCAQNARFDYGWRPNAVCVYTAGLQGMAISGGLPTHMMVHNQRYWVHLYDSDFLEISPRVSWWRRQKACFIFGRSRIQISAQRPAILIEAFMVFLNPSKQMPE
jgi:hypothetical protein